MHNDSGGTDGSALFCGRLLTTGPLHWANEEDIRWRGIGPACADPRGRRKSNGH